MDSDLRSLGEERKPIIEPKGHGQERCRLGKTPRSAAALPCRHGNSISAHYWAREFTKRGHQVRLMPAKDVKADVKRDKDDAADAEAIGEAVRRPTEKYCELKFGLSALERLRYLGETIRRSH